jgi:glycosyltransferase involved in cell wall biosynthesis
MLSIIIPTYNSERFMPQLLDSIFKQAVDDMEVIIVDDCSGDRTVEIARQYSTRVIQMEKNGGPARARNKGVEAAQGDIIFFLDSDVELLEGTILEVKEYFKNNPSSNCVIGLCSTKPLNKGFVPAYMAMFEYIHLLGAQDKKLSVFAPRCGAIKKALFLKVGGYDEKYKSADVEDFELARRINKVDSISLNPKMLVRHQFVNNFIEAINNYFKRAVMWIHLFIREKQFDNAGPTATSNGIAAACAFFSFLSLFFIPFVSASRYAFVLLFIIFLFANLSWAGFMRREAGFIFAVKALFLNYILGIDIIIASSYGLISYVFSRKGTAGG